MLIIGDSMWVFSGALLKAMPCFSGTKSAIEKFTGFSKCVCVEFITGLLTISLIIKGFK